MSERCQATVWRRSGQVAGWGRDYPCQKAAVKDGFCGTHHPDATAKREARLEEEREAQRQRDRARWAREARDRNLIAVINGMSADDIAALPLSLRAILSPEEARDAE